MKEKIYGGIYGHIIGDILGVPVEFKKKEYISNYPITDMTENALRKTTIGYWSDDTAMSLCSIKSIINCKDINDEDIMDTFVKWVRDGYLTAGDKCFGIGRATLRAINNYVQSSNLQDYYLHNNPNDKMNGGNGAMMRILPLILYSFFNDKNSYKNLDNSSSRARKLDRICFNVSLTHNNKINDETCSLYSMIIFNLLNGQNKDDAYSNAIEEHLIRYGGVQSSDLQRLLNGNIREMNVKELNTTGYVVFTLETALWCFLNSDSYKETVLKAVNLLGDADTIAAIAGSMAGIYYGYSSIPIKWIENIIKKDIIDGMVNDFYKEIGV